MNELNQNLEMLSNTFITHIHNQFKTIDCFIYKDTSMYQLFEILSYFLFRLDVWLYMNNINSNVREDIITFIREHLCHEYYNYEDRQQILASTNYRLNEYAKRIRKDKDDFMGLMMFMSSFLGYAREKENLSINRAHEIYIRDIFEVMNETEAITSIHNIAFNSFIRGIKKILVFDKDFYQQTFFETKALFHAGIDEYYNENI